MRFVSILLILFNFSAQAGTPEIDALNQYERVSEKTPESAASLMTGDRAALFQRAVKHPVTDLNHLDQYDPQGFIGFCFGRAMGVHLMGRLAGLERPSVRKLFIIGDLRSGADPEWRFHVTTLVKGQETNQWYAVDPIMTPPLAPGGPLLMAEWVRIVRATWDKKKQAKLYFTSPDTVMPDVTLDPNGTTGNAVLETVFDPLTKTGFAAETLEGVEVFKTDATAEATYFISVKEPESDRFKFDGLVIEGQNIDYNGYFLKLLGDLSGDVPLPTVKTVTASGFEVVQPLTFQGNRPRKPQLRSPRFDRFFPRQVPQ